MTRLLAVDAAGIAEAAALLRAGQLVAFGTETVYGLGGDATSARATAAIFAAKGRPHFNPLICHFATAEAAFVHVARSAMAESLAAAFWPGPLTMVLPRRPTTCIDLLAGAGLDTLAVRVPASLPARALLQAAGVPIAAPSANRSGAVSPTTAAHVMADLAGLIAAILDCGPATGGLESTVLDLTGPRPFLLRPGGIPAEAIEAFCGEIGRGITPAEAGAARGLRSPGLLVSHYAPRTTLRLNAETVGPAEALLAFGPTLATAGPVWQLSLDGNVAEAASRLFAGLRWLDAQAATAIAVMPIPSRGLGAAINDRLQRAAAPR